MPLPLEKLDGPLEGSRVCGLISLKTGEWTEPLAQAPGLENLRAGFASRGEDRSAKTPGDCLNEFCAIDPHSQTMRLSLKWGVREIPFLQEAWLGWTVVHEAGGVREHFRHMGRETCLRSLAADDRHQHC